MPRKAKNQKDSGGTERVNKKNLMDTIVKDITPVENEDIILQLPITEKCLDEKKSCSTIPEPYEPNCCFLNEDTSYNTIQDNNIFNNHTIDTFDIKGTNNCYWCCHPIENRMYGMPYKYNSISDTYTLYGCFCSLNCANAYNFSIHCGSDKVWEINSYIQMLSKHYGCTHPIRPAPSKYLLKSFNGPLTIEEFRKAHHTNDKTHILNLPPMISTSFNYEVINTSYLKNITDNMNIIKNEHKREPKHSIDAKLNLIIS